METEGNDKVEVDMSAENNITSMNSDKVVESEQQSQSYSIETTCGDAVEIKKGEKNR
jgi:hypothetical protein